MRSMLLTGTAMLTAMLLTGCGTESVPTNSSGEEPASNPASPSLTAAPVIGLTPTSLRFLLYAFRTYQPASQTVKITNVGGKTLTWTAKDNAAWLKFAPILGTAPSTMTVSVDRTALPIGINGSRPVYLQATITVSAAGASNTPQTIPVLLRISYVR